MRQVRKKLVKQWTPYFLEVFQALFVLVTALLSAHLEDDFFMSVFFIMKENSTRVLRVVNNLKF